MKELVHAVAGSGRSRFHRVEEGGLETQARMAVAILRLLESVLYLQGTKENPLYFKSSTISFAHDNPSLLRATAPFSRLNISI